MVDFKKIISELIESGHTQSSIARSIGAHRNSISMIVRGETKAPLFNIGIKLMTLHAAIEKKDAK